MYLVNPKDRHRYFIRLLLLHVKGATSFENLRTVDCVIHPTFYEAAVRAGLRILPPYGKNPCRPL